MTDPTQKSQTAPFAGRPHILVVDDDQRIRELVSRYLKENGYVSLAAADAAQAQDILEMFDVDALVLDVMMPGKTGLEFTQEVRKNSDIPILLLTALGETQDRIKGLEVGADDYLPKPFEPKELLLRLNAILKRVPKKPSDAQSFKIGPWCYDRDQETLIHEDGSEAKITAAEQTLLGALLNETDKVWSRDELSEACGLNAGERTIDVQVTRLRKKIEEDTKNPRLLQTIRGKGYMLRFEVL